MKNYSDTVLGVLKMADGQGGKSIYPDDLRGLKQFRTAPRDTRVGYLGKLVKIGLLVAPEDKVSSRYTLAEKGDWVVRMYLHGWAYADDMWTHAEGGLSLDAQTRVEIESMRLVPKVDITEENVEDLQES